MTLLRAASVIVAMPSLNSGTAGPSPVGDPGLWYCAFGSSKVSPGKGDYDRRPRRAAVFCCARFARLPKDQKLIGCGAFSERRDHHSTTGLRPRVLQSVGTLLDQDASPLPLAQLLPKSR